MEEPIPIFENKYANYVQQLDSDCAVIMSNLKMIYDGKARAGYFNEISEKVTNMQQTGTALKHLAIKKEIIGLEVNKKMHKVLTLAIEVVKEEAAKDPNDPMGLKQV